MSIIIADKSLYNDNKIKNKLIAININKKIKTRY